MPDIEVTATGNVAGGVQALQKVQQELGKTAVAATKMDSSLDHVSKTLNTGLKNGANQATGAMINLGRVVQDAPFGFLGIANNINPLLESFQRLKAESGSTGGALKALSSSLLGAGGLGLAVSVVSGLMSYFALNSLSKTGDQATKHEKEIIRVKDAYQIFREELDKVIGTIAGEASKVSILFGALGDSNIKLDERATVIGQLNAISPAYLGNLDKEKASYEEISKAVSAYIDDLGKAAFIKSFVPEFEGLFKKLISTQVELRNLNLAQKGVFGMSEADYAAERKRLETQIRLFTQDITTAKKFLTREAGGALNLQEILFGKNAPEGKAAKPIKVTGPIQFKPDKITFFDDGGVSELMAEALSKLNKGQSNVFKGGGAIQIPVSVDEKTLENTRQNLITKLQEQGVSTADRILENGLKIKIPLEIATTKELNAAFDATEALIEQRTKDITSIFKTTMESAFSSVADSIGNLIAGKGTLGDLFDGLFKTIGNGLKSLGQYLVKTYLLIAVIDKIKFSNPAVGVAVGFALQVLGAAINAAITSKKAFASGGTVMSGGTKLVGEYGPERIFLPTGSRVQPNNEVMAYAGSSTGYIAETKISGSDLVILLRRGEQTMGRNN